MLRAPRPQSAAAEVVEKDMAQVSVYNVAALLRLLADFSNSTASVFSYLDTTTKALNDRISILADALGKAKRSVELSREGFAVRDPETEATSKLDNVPDSGFVAWGLALTEVSCVPATRLLARLFGPEFL